MRLPKANAADAVVELIEGPGTEGLMAEVASARELGKESLLDAYRTMRVIREFGERLHAAFATGEIPGFVHLQAGEEAKAAPETGEERGHGRD